ncbi:TPA: hypothetical protein HA338_04250 [Methanosarcina acetivorans]|uniref:Polysaccharide deacetylase n=2 Tax=Methanosarcina acetivorans TaxID=2214 RepID=Q8TRV3_METAC|nr:hypothetical protein [Methanosarcina acetivorans]AAM04491.1 predicted protein [Methanosarcina acetivorans C2A]HIH93270.1 hypothetical protein [Methanosarcina acetivorans]
MLNFHNLDFTHDKYRQLCSAISDRYTFLTMHEYVIAGDNLPEKFVLIRHDVDKLARNALETANIEKEYGIKATYYFRTHKKAFVPEIIQKIEKMGHEVGYHYEVLSTAKGDHEKAIKLFESDVQKFRKICNLKTICMHGAVLSKYDNRELWKFYNLEDFGILGEAYLSTGEDLNYFTDTGRSWNSKNNLRDFIPGKKERIFAEKTDDLIELIEKCEISNFYISAHPDRWKSNIVNWSLFWIYDFILNSGKKILMAVRP